MSAGFDAFGIGDRLLRGLQVRGWDGRRAGAGGGEQKDRRHGESQAMP
jgi:hypothetical protein